MLEGWQEASSILGTFNYGVTCELRCYVVLSAPCVWNCTCLCTQGKTAIIMLQISGTNDQTQRQCAPSLTHISVFKGRSAVIMLKIWETTAQSLTACATQCLGFWHHWSFQQSGASMRTWIPLKKTQFKISKNYIATSIFNSKHNLHFLSTTHKYFSDIMPNTARFSK
jgi:hypothetical protein